MNDPRVRVLAGPCRGVAAAFNAGLANATGEFVARCDADDLYCSGRLQWQIGWLNDRADFAAVCGSFSVISSKGLHLRDLNCGQTHEEITSELQRGDTRTSLCTWLVRRELLCSVGGCREFFAIGEDIDLQLRLGEAGRVWFEPRICCRARLHDSSITHSNRRGVREFYEDAARRFQRQRLQGESDDLQRGEPPSLPLHDRSPVECSRYHAQNILMGAAWEEKFCGRNGRALRTALRACLIRPTNIDAWKNLGAIAIRGS